MMNKLAVLATVVLLLGSTSVAAFAALVDERDASTAAAIEVSDSSATFSDDRDETAEISSQAAPVLYLPAPAEQSAFADEGVNDSAAFDR